LHRCATMLFLLPFLLAGVAEAEGATLYVNRLLTAGPGDVSLGALVRASGDIPAEAREALARSVAVLGDKVMYIPAAAYREQLEGAFGKDSIIVGTRSIVVPEGALPEGGTFLIERLADFLAAQGLLGAAPAELSIAQSQVKGGFPQEGNPVFQVLRNANGSAEVSFSLTGTGGNSVSGRVSLSRVTGPAESTEGIRSGAPVQVLFRKGPITIEMPGKALASAAVGGKVSVFIPDSQKNFVGRAVGGKAVEVDLP
jgi:hypothetical protein